MPELSLPPNPNKFSFLDEVAAIVDKCLEENPWILTIGYVGGITKVPAVDAFGLKKEIGDIDMICFINAQHYAFPGQETSASCLADLSLEISALTERDGLHLCAFHNPYTSFKSSR